MGRAQYWSGFQLLSELDEDGFRSFPILIATAITRGTPLIFDGTGFVKPATTLQGTVIVAGIASVTTTAAQAVASGTIKAQVVPLLREYRFMVPVGSAALITQAAVGTLNNVKAGAIGSIDITSAVTLGYGFMVEDFDASAAAVAANAAGFAIGHFEYQAAS